MSGTPARRRPISALSVGDILGPVDETLTLPPADTSRRSTVQGTTRPRPRGVPVSGTPETTREPSSDPSAVADVP